MLQKFNTGLDSFLTREQLEQQCLVAFKTIPTNPGLSDKYLQVNTSTVVEDLSKLGWYPVSASMRKSRKEDTIFSKHMITFQNPELIIKGENGDDAYPRIILMNSHDGFSSFKFSVGVFRLVCSNGLVIATHQFSDFKIRHIGYNFQELQSVIGQAIVDLPQHVNIINSMQETTLTASQQQELALKALQIRTGKPDLEVDMETIEEMLLPLREMDKGEDLWRTFNRIQERVIRGGFQAALTGKKPRMVKPIKGFENDLRINKELFSHATSMIPCLN